MPLNPGEAERAILLYETDPAYWERVLSEHPDADEWTSSGVAVASLVQKMRSAGQPEAEPNQIVEGKEMVNAVAAEAGNTGAEANTENAPVVAEASPSPEAESTPMLTAGTHPAGQAVAETEIPTDGNAETGTALPVAADTQAEPQPTTEPKAEESNEATAEPTLLNVVKTLYEKGKTAASKLFSMTFFDVAKTPDFMKKLGLTGEKFTIRYGVISRHFGKDGSHDLTATEWEQLPDAIQRPFAITKLSDKKDGYRLYTTIKTAKGEYVVVGVDVKNAGKDIEVNAISTVFGRRENGNLPSNEEVLYKDKKITPEQSSLLNRPNFGQYPTEQELSEGKDTPSVAKKQEDAAEKDIDEAKIKAALEALKDTSKPLGIRLAMKLSDKELAKAHEMAKDRRVLIQLEAVMESREEKRAADKIGQAVADAAKEVDVNPTEAQKEAGNYRKGHVRVDGMDISIEQPKGSVRRGTDADGKQWESVMHDTYGYIRGTEGVDGDHIDVFLSDHPDKGGIFVVDQVDPKTGKFDEHKVMYGYADEEEAKAAYLANYEKGWRGLGAITAVSREDFRKWVGSGRRKTKPFSEYKIAQAEPKVDAQGNPLNADGTLRVEKVRSVDEITDADFTAPTRSIELPKLPGKVDAAIGTDGKPVVIKKNILERNAERHPDITASQSRDILRAALYSPDLYGQNQKAKRPYNWVVINTKDKDGKNRLVLLEISPNKESVEIVHWHYARNNSLEQIKRQAESEGGLILILPSEKSEEAGGLSSRTPGLSSEGKGNEKISDEKEGKPAKYNGYLDGKTKLTASAIDRNLSKRINIGDTSQSIAEHIEGWHKDGSLKVEANEYMPEPNRRRWNKMYQDEQDAWEAAHSKPKTQHLTGDGKHMYELGKTAYDYAKWLLGSDAAAKQPAGEYSSVNNETADDTPAKEDAEKSYYAAFDHESDVEEEWEEKIQDYVWEHYPTQAVLSAESTSEQGLREREAMRKDAVLKRLREEAKEATDKAREATDAALDKLEEARAGRKPRLQKADGEIEATAEDRALRDAVVERMRESGLDVITDDAEGQRVLDEVNGEVKMSAKKKRALETASLGETPRSLTVVSSADGANVLKNIDALATEFDNSTTQPKTFVGDVAKALGAERQGSTSEYATFETKNGRVVTIRLANHNAKVSNFDNHGESEGISIVVSPKQSEGITNDGSAHVVEYYYDAIRLRRADGKPLADILRSIKQALYSGEFTDTTGLAERQEVNAGDVVRYNKVYHGSAADFDRFDHTHMGEGEGAQAYGWGTYVTEVEGIGRTYAETDAENRGIEMSREDALEEYEWAMEKISDQLHGEFGIPDGVELHVDAADGVYFENKDDGDIVDAGRKYFEKHPDALEWYSLDEMGDEEIVDEYESVISDKGNEMLSSDEYRNAGIVHNWRYLYTVEIPDDTGKNYLDWDKKLTSQQKDVISKAVKRLKIDLSSYESRGFTLDGTGEDMYHFLSYILRHTKKWDDENSQRAVSKFLSSLGFTGIKYPADFMRGGREDGKKNYVIFNEADAKITDRVRFFRTADGEAYGYTAGGKIYIDPRVAKADTPIHEYSHLWSAAMREANPGEWANIVELMRGTGLWDEVKSRYPELETDDDIADEVLAHYSGRRGAERLRAEQQRIIEGDGTVLETAAALSALERVADALRRFWKGVADFLHIHFTTAEEVADRVLHDLLRGVDPRKYGKNGGDAVKFRKVFGGNSGYVGYSMSKRAAFAREEGRFPKTDFKSHYGMTDSHFKALLDAGILDDSEWHHTSMYGNETTFYRWDEPEYADVYDEHKEEIGKIVKDRNTRLRKLKTELGYSKEIEKGLNPYEYDADKREERSVWERKRFDIQGSYYTAARPIMKECSDAIVNVFEKYAGPLIERRIFMEDYQRELNRLNNDYALYRKERVNEALSSLLPFTASNGVIIKGLGELTREHGQSVGMKAGKIALEEFDAAHGSEVAEAERNAPSIKDYMENEYRSYPSNSSEGARKAAYDFMNGGAQQRSLKDGEESQNIEAINTKFNEELQQQIDGTLPSNHIYKMGRPGKVLLSTGVPDLPIQMNANRLQDKATKFDHDFDLAEVKDLVKALQSPLAVFAYGDKNKAQNIIVPLQKGGKNFIVGLSLNPTVGGKSLEINSIRNVFPKDNSEWMNWISQGKALYLDKEKIQILIDQQRTNLADVDYLDLDSVAKVIENFENPKSPEIQGTDTEMQEIVETAKADGSYMKAPNGEPTELEEHQWAQVRTKAFKNWFGDWESDPENASKVVDENGEPLVVFHYTGKHFTVFGKDKVVGENTFGNAGDASYAATTTIGHWFTTNGDLAADRGKPMRVFLNIRDAKDMQSLEGLAESVGSRISAEAAEAYEDDWEDNEGIKEAGRAFVEDAMAAGHDGVVIDDEEFGGTSYVAFLPNQIKSATGNIGTFSTEQDNILLRSRKGVATGSEVRIVEAAAEHGFANYAAAKRWAKENIARTYGNDETGGKGEIRISNKVIEKFLSESAVKNSESRDAHLSTLRVLPEVIRESVDAEQHPDYKKDGGGKRAPENGVNPDVTIHRLYGAMRIGGKLYRVKVTLKEDARNPELAKKAYSYEATKIELLAGTLAKPEGDDPNTNNSISAAKLLNGVEKSYGNGEKLIDADFAALPKPERRVAVEREAAAVDAELGTHTIVKDTAELDDAMRSAVEQGGGCAYYDPATGETVVLADRALSAADVRASVVHENIGHKSLDELLGGKAGGFYREVAQHIATAEELDALRKDYPGADGERLGSEWMAHLSETEAWEKRQKRA